MIVALSLVLLGLIAVLVIANHLEAAPEGFQDEKGFHVLVRHNQSEEPMTPPIGRAREVAG